MNDKEMMEQSLAEGWSDGKYTKQQVQDIAKERGLTFFSIIKHYFKDRWERNNEN